MERRRIVRLGAEPSWRDQARRASWFLIRHPSIAVVLFVAIYGFHNVDVEEFRRITQNPFVVNVKPESQVLYGSPFTFLLGSYYQHQAMDPWTAFLTVHALGILALAVSLRTALGRHADAQQVGIATTVMLSSPLLLITLFWFGKSDAFLLAFFFLFTVAESPPTRILLGALTIVCHRELGAAVLVAHLCLRPRDWRTVVPGIVLGELAVFTYTHVLLASPPASRLDYAATHMLDLWHVFGAHPVLHIWAALGPFWIYVFARRTAPLPTLAVLAMALVLSIASYDFTRVFVIVSAPLILEVARSVAGTIASDSGFGIGAFRLPTAVMWTIGFLQIQIVELVVFWAQGFEIRLSR